MKNKRLLWPILLIFLTNSIVLAKVAYNRSGDKQTTVTLTERELSVPYRSNEEDSGIALQLQWDLFKFKNKGSRDFPAEMVTPEKLKALGYPCDIQNGSTGDDPCYKRNLPIKAFIVIEFDGPSFVKWQKGNQEDINKTVEKIALKNDKQQSKYLKQELKRLESAPLIKSRLFVIDFGASYDSLRVQYPDKTKYIIAQGLIRVSSYYKSSKEKFKLNVWAQEILMDSIHVEPKWRDFFDSLPEKRFNSYSAFNVPDSEIKPRYQVTLNYGKLHEPWIETISLYP